MAWILILYTLAPSHWGLISAGFDTIQIKTEQDCKKLLETIRDKEPHIRGFCVEK